MSLSIAEKLISSTVRIECELKNGQKSTGTGFFFNFVQDDDHNVVIPVIITNKHVISNSQKGKFIITKATKEGAPIYTEHFIYEYSNFESLWKFHPDKSVDLCALPISFLINEARMRGEELFYIPYDKNLLLTEEQKTELTAIEDVLMIGYPNGIWDSSNNMPICRKGITATNPILDYNGNKEFMIDIAAFPGSSGSPVLIFNQNGYSDRKGNIYFGRSRVILLGILYAGPQSLAEGQIVMLPNSSIPIALSKIPNNLGMVIKAERILEMEDLFKY